MTSSPRFKACLFASVVSLLISSDCAAEKPIFETSFEDMKSGQFDNAEINGFKFTTSGTCNITKKYARTGKQCLHLLGDEGNVITLNLPTTMQNVKGISFHAERWTSRDPFAFSVDVNANGKWKRIAKLDQVTVVGARFLSHIQLAIKEEAKISAIRFRVAAASKAGLLIDDLALFNCPPDRPTAIPSESFPTKPLQLASRQTLFKSGTNDTHTYRIPAVVTAKNGDIVVACDARRKNSADLVHQRTIDIVFRRSTDNGNTWSPIEVMDPITNGGCSDPSLLLDRETGEIFCFYNYMSNDKSSKEYRFILQKSADHGKTWSEPEDFTEQVAGPELKNSFKFITSGRGIQTSDGTLMHNYVQVGKGVTVITSTDHGKSWSAVVDVPHGDESKLVELADGSLMINSRIAPGRRNVHRSQDGGKTWNTEADYSLCDPRCNASIIRYPVGLYGNNSELLLFCNAASNSERKNLAVRLSKDNGDTWSDGHVIDSGPSAYSELDILSDGKVIVVYEPGHSEIRAITFELDELLTPKK